LDDLDDLRPQGPVGIARFHQPRWIGDLG
jgi:hypothetical protein